MSLQMWKDALSEKKKLFSGLLLMAFRGNRYTKSIDNGIVMSTANIVIK